MHLQYHKERVTSRDKSIISAAAQLSLPGYVTGPFQQDRVEQFLKEFTQHRAQAKKKADEEKVSRWSQSHNVVFALLGCPELPAKAHLARHYVLS